MYPWISWQYDQVQLYPNFNLVSYFCYGIILGTHGS